MKKATRQWVRKAESDYSLAAKLGRAKSEPFHDERCFHCQQSAEKYLKAIMTEHGLAVPKSHNLDDLFSLLHQLSLRLQRRGLIFLSDFAVGVRYPGKNATKRQAASAFRWAGRVRSVCRAHLGIAPARRQ
ncbi:MAG: HEPN domain-containing protein [Gemmataceae bacterium]|nr:HEPN domain-containing protein [Gemmataceae bacterium]